MSSFVLFFFGPTLVHASHSPLYILEGTYLILVGLLLVADGQVRGVDVQVDVVVAGDAPAALLSCRHPLELHVGIAAVLPLLARGGQAVDPPVHIHCPQQGDGHGCT